MRIIFYVLRIGDMWIGLEELNVF